MGKSIMQSDPGVSYLSGAAYGLEKHHVFYGQGRRELSEKYGLFVWLTHDEHNEPPFGIHFNRDARRALERDGQAAFEREYPDLEFKKIFGRNYL